MASEAQRAAVRRYDKTNTRQVLIKLNTHTDADIISWLEAQKNKQGAIKEALREHIMREVAQAITPKLDRLMAEWVEEYGEPPV